MGLKDVSLISGMKVVKTNFNPIEASHPAFRIVISLDVEKLHTRRLIKLFLVVDALVMLNQGMRNITCLTSISREWFICSCATPFSQDPTTTRCPNI